MHALLEAVFERSKPDLEQALKEHLRELDSARDRDGRTALINAVAIGHADLTRLLLEAGANPSLNDLQGWTALHFAAMNHNPQILGMLISAGAPIDARDLYGNTPLMKAVYYDSARRLEVIRALVAAGADPDAANLHGNSPRSLSETAVNRPVDWSAVKTAAH